MPGKGVATTHRDFEKYAPKWRRCRDVSDGQDSMHTAGVAYLPKLKDETDDGYRGRVKRSNFFNGSWRTLAVLQGMLFRKPPAMELPTAIEPFLADIDLAGTSLETFARTIALETLEVGRVGIMVDHPPAQLDEEGKVVPITQAVAETMGLRPTLQFYRAECIINWRYRRIRNRNRLCLVVLKEQASVMESEFEEKLIDQWRVLDLDDADQYRVRLFQREKEVDVQIGDDMYPLMNGVRLDYIPFGIVGVDGIDSAADEPPLIDLIDANIAHYQVNADYRHGLHFTGLPTPVVSGYQPENATDKLYIGSTTAWVFPDSNAKAAYLEFTGQGLTELREALKEIKQEMALLGARAIADETKQAETFGATVIKRGGETSILSAIAMAISEALEWSLGIFAEWAGQSGKVAYQLNRDFMPAGLSSQDLTALIAANQAGKISDQELYAQLQAADLVDSEKSFDEHQAEVEVSGGPVRPEPAVKPDPKADAA